MFHVGVILKPLAVFGTLRANLGAHTTGPRVQQGAAEHEIGTGLADLGAIE